MATFNNKRFLHNTKASAATGKTPDAFFTAKKYDYDDAFLEEPDPNDLYPVDGWQRGTRMLSGLLLHVIFSPSSETSEQIDDLLVGLPRSLSIQAFKAAEDLMRLGRAGHFVSCPKEGTLRFDTSVEAQAYIYDNAGAQEALEVQVINYILLKTKDLVFLV